MSTEKPIKRLESLLCSLEVLLDQEEMLIKDGLIEKIPDVQERIAAISTALVTHAEELKKAGLLTPGYRKRAHASLQRQQAIVSIIRSQIGKVQDGLHEIQSAKSRIKNMRPVYGKSPFMQKSSSGSSLDEQG